MKKQDKKILPSDLPKDTNFSGRMNKDVKAELKRLGMSPQKIIDAYVDATLKVNLDVTPKYIKKIKS